MQADRPTSHRRLSGDGWSRPEPAAAAPSGAQHELVHGVQRATVVEIGGGVRVYTHGGRDVLQPYAVDAVCDGAHGTPLAPWPNRLGDGRFDFGGEHFQVPLTEPEKQNAIHGFLRWRSWDRVDSGDRSDLVRMRVRLHPTSYWPFDLLVTVTYVLDDAGLGVSAVARNVGDRVAPWAYGQHPYLSPGTGTIDDCRLTFRAGTRITTNRRQLPTGHETVAETPYDFAWPRQIGTTQIDHAFTDLDRDDDGRAWLGLEGNDGRTVSAWIDSSFGYLEVYTADTLAADRRRRGLGVEPMTAPPNGLQTGTNVVRLEPGASVTHRWGARLEPRGS